MNIAEDKAAWRRILTGRRRARSAPDRDAARAALAGWLITELAGAGTVCAYLPLVSEPLDPGLAARLRAAGTRVLLPIASPGRPLDWGLDTGAVRRGAFGIDEPDAAALGIDAVGTADVVLVPALAIDARGVRLGRGGGHYDRTLALAPQARTIALVYDDERVAELPFDDFDRPVGAVATPTGGVVRIGR